MDLLLLFVILNVVNVVLQTIKSIATVKCGKFAASAINAIAYGLYTVCLVYMNCELSLWAKVAVVGGANLVGVFVVKTLEDKMRRDKLWEVRMTVREDDYGKVTDALKGLDLPYSALCCDNENRVVINVYCATQKESNALKTVIAKYPIKYFVTESRTL